MIERRERGPRIIAILTAHLKEGTAHYVVDTENLSESGLCLCPQNLFPPGTGLHMVFGLPPALPMISAEGIVRWSEGGRGVGVEFTSISQDDRQSLLKFLGSLSSRQ
jgi:hypothetical protein